MEGATHVAWVSVLLESVWRTHKCSQHHGYSLPVESLSYGAVYLGAYVMCIAVIFLDIKRYAFFKQPALRGFITFLHAIDGIIAFVLSLAYYHKSHIMLCIGVLAMTKCFLLHLLSRMVTGQAAFGSMAISLQTTKTFLHHTGSFLFLGDGPTALITGLWRFISMNGHAAMTLRDRLDTKTYDRVIWNITHARNSVLAVVLATCFVNPAIRRGFALSATGHVAYMVVRLGPIFRIGSIYLHTELERKQWNDRTDMERLSILYSGQHPWFTLELGLLAFACIYFTYLRLTTYGIVEGNSCQIV